MAPYVSPSEALIVPEIQYFTFLGILRSIFFPHKTSIPSYPPIEEFSSPKNFHISMETQKVHHGIPGGSYEIHRVCLLL